MKTKYFFRNSVKYLRELSVVVVGIAITFGLGNWINNRNEQKNLQRYLAMIKIELEDNLPVIQDQFEFYDHTGRLAKYLFPLDKQNDIQTDSIAKYTNTIKWLSFMVYKSSAFEMMKSSGTMSLIKDRELLKSIIDCYSSMERCKSISDKTIDSKSRELYNAVMENGMSDDFFELKDLKNKRLFHYLSIYTATEGNFRECTQQIEKTLALF